MSEKIRKLYRGDCLEILAEYIKPGSVDLIYLDPPFNSKSIYNLPFKKKDKNLRPVEVFKDIWTWTVDDDIRMDEFQRSPEPQCTLATIVEFAQRIEHKEGRRRRNQSSLASYLLNMSERLLAMKPVLKSTGCIYLHCDPTAGHYLKLVMDVIFGKKNFKNELIWAYRTGGVSKKWFSRKHDTILFYSKSDKYTFNLQKERSYSTSSPPGFKGVKKYRDDHGRWYTMATMRDVWSINAIGRTSSERLGYPTQKPLALLERIIKASSKPGDLVLDPFCGCGTTAHAAELLNRSWVGIDISRFSTELIRERVIGNFPARLTHDDVRAFGLPETLSDARKLASEDAFEFEKWVCAAIGANGMYRDLGRKGPDSGIDGVMEIAVIRNRKVVDEYVIIQVKGGKVTPDSVKALSETVRRREAVAGIMVCFKDQMGTVENQRSTEIWSDDYQSYPVIQGYSIDDLLQNRPLDLPPRYGRRRGGRIRA